MKIYIWKYVRRNMAARDIRAFSYEKLPYESVVQKTV